MSKWYVTFKNQYLFSANTLTLVECRVARFKRNHNFESVEPNDFLIGSNVGDNYFLTLDSNFEIADGRIYK